MLVRGAPREEGLKALIVIFTVRVRWKMSTDPLHPHAHSRETSARVRRQLFLKFDRQPFIFGIVAD